MFGPSIAQLREGFPLDFADFSSCPARRHKIRREGGGKMTFRELCAKEVVQLQEGVCLGRVDDLELDPDTAQIRELLLFGRPKLFGLLGREDTLTIRWEDIEKIGVDAVLVHTEIPTPEPQAGKSGLLERLRNWFKG